VFRMCRFGLGLAVSFSLFVVLGAALPSGAAEAVRANAEEFVPGEHTPPGEAHVLLSTFMAPVVRGPTARPHLKPVSLILKVPSEAAQTVCHMSPRVQDAVIRVLFKEPIRTRAKSGLEVEPTEKRLLMPVRQVLDGAAVEQIFLIPGAVPNPEVHPLKRLPHAEIMLCGSRS